MFGIAKPPSAGSPKDRARIGREVAARLEANRGVQPALVGAARAYYYPDFLDAADCETLIALIDGDRRPSTVLSDRSAQDDYGFRTSDSCDLERYAPDVLRIDTRIAELLGIEPLKGETIQGQRYAPGQQFRAHHDYFHENQGYWEDMKKSGGQRTWTAMVYLNDVEEGGATWFPQAGLRVAPRRGLLLAWDNMDANGKPNPLTLHEGMPVVRGVKYIITKWFRERNWATY